MNYSNEYKRLFENAVAAGASIGLKRKPMVTADQPVEQGKLEEVRDWMADFSDHLNLLIPGYWGNSCQTLSAQIFAFLNAEGVAAEIILGNVIINDTDAFGTTLDSLKSEYLAKEALTGPQALHAWVSIGEDTIIDAALPPRLVKHFGFPTEMDGRILTARASLFAEKLGILYEPIIVGAEYFAKTNPPDPFILMERWKSMRA